MARWRRFKFASIAQANAHPGSAGWRNFAYNTGMDEMLTIGAVETSAGRYHAVFTRRGLARLSFPTDDPATCEHWRQRWAPAAALATDDARLAELAEQLDAYFAGRLRDFSVSLDLHGTPFQRRVWEAVLGVGYGERRSYAAVAEAIGAPRAFRAVGAANGANPVPILVPCHRLVGADGRLVKYGGGLATKQRLLELEATG